MHKADADMVAEVIGVEQRWVRAHRELDLDAIEEILADEYLQIRADGTVIGKTEALQSYRSGKRKWDFADSDEYQVVVHGDAVILVGSWRGRGENDGEPFDYAARFMAIYVRRNGEWRLVADQSTPLVG